MAQSSCFGINPHFCMEEIVGESMEFFKVAISLLGVLGLVFLVFFGLRMLNRRISTSGGRLRVIDRATLGRDSMLLVVSVCGKLLLVGVSPQRVEKLSELDMSEQEYVDMAFANARGYSGSGGGNGGAAGKVLPFSDILSSFIGRKKGHDAQNNGSDEPVSRYRDVKDDENAQDS